jgi:hypothetical protein
MDWTVVYVLILLTQRYPPDERAQGALRKLVRWVSKMAKFGSKVVKQVKTRYSVPLTEKS